MISKDPYKILGVSPTASDAEIKSAYKELVKKYKNTKDKTTKHKIKEHIINLRKELILDFNNNSKNVLNLKKLLNGYTNTKEVKKGYVQQFK